MEENRQDQNPEDETDQKYLKGDSPQSRGAKTKRRNAWAVFFDGFGALLIAFAGFSFFVNHLEIPSIALFFIGAAFVTLGIRLSLMNRMKASTANACFWSILLAIFVLCIMLAVIVFPKPSVPPKPHLTVSLQLGDSEDSVVLLTNDFLCTSGFVTNRNRPDGSFIFQDYPDGCLVIPMQPGETSKVFNFVAENDSPVKITDLQVMVGFPKNMVCNPGDKWGKVKATLIVPGLWKITLTNLQFWAAQTPLFLFPHDSIAFPPITNTSIVTYSREGDTGGFFSVSVRCTDFNRLISANIIYAPASLEISNPFVTRAVYDSRKQLHILPP
jgi:hypothetical protein